MLPDDNKRPLPIIRHDRAASHTVELRYLARILDAPLVAQYFQPSDLPVLHRLRFAWATNMRKWLSKQFQDDRSVILNDRELHHEYDRYGELLTVRLVEMERRARLSQIWERGHRQALKCPPSVVPLLMGCASQHATESTSLIYKLLRAQDHQCSEDSRSKDKQAAVHKRASQD